MQKYPIIRTIYLYTFSLVGLVLMIIGGVRFIDMGLKAFVFTKADEEQRYYLKQPPMATVPIEKLQPATQGRQVTLSETETQTVRLWLADYENWQKQQTDFDPVTSSRQRDASTNLALILIGLPLYFYHWSVIKKETKKVELT